MTTEEYFLSMNFISLFLFWNRFLIFLFHLSLKYLGSFSFCSDLHALCVCLMQFVVVTVVVENLQFSIK